MRDKEDILYIISLLTESIYCFSVCLLKPKDSNTFTNYYNNGVMYLTKAISIIEED